MCHLNVLQILEVLEIENPVVVVPSMSGFYFLPFLERHEDQVRSPKGFSLPTRYRLSTHSSPNNLSISFNYWVIYVYTLRSCVLLNFSALIGSLGDHEKHLSKDGARFCWFLFLSFSSTAVAQACAALNHVIRNYLSCENFFELRLKSDQPTAKEKTRIYNRIIGWTNQMWKGR